MKTYKLFLFIGLINLLSLGLIESDFFIKKSRLNWNSENQISWYDFHATPNYFQIVTQDYGAEIYSHFDYKATGEKYDTLIIEAYMSPHHSWATDLMKESSYSLEHEQYHFNITELVARNFRKDASEFLNKKYDEQILEKLYIQNLSFLNEIQNNYDIQTDHSLIRKEQEKWVEIIDTLLIIFNDYKNPVISINDNINKKKDLSLMPKLFELLYKSDNSQITGEEYNNMFDNSISYDNNLVLYYDNGQKKSEALYIDGKLEGTYTTWYETGELKRTIQYKNGERNGLTIEYYKNRQKKSEANYNNGVNRSKVEYWNPDGSIQIEEENE